MADLFGQTLGNYRIEGMLGTGGMGRVYRGTHVHLGRQAAVKVMHGHLATDPGFQARFLQEARAAATLQHPNIVQIFDFGTQGDVSFFVMEIVGDGSLRTVIDWQQQHGPAPLAVNLELVRQAADGLGYAHRQGFIHRDIKPENLLLQAVPDPAPGQLTHSVKVGDFGLARLAESRNMTMSGMVMGTPAYMSPEQCQGAAVDARSDVYSLGVVLFELVVGTKPFEVRTATDAIYNHVFMPPPAPRSVRADVPEAVEQIILRCLAKQPGERYASASEVAADVRALIASLSQPPATGAVTLVPGAFLGQGPDASTRPHAPAGVEPGTSATSSQPGSLPAFTPTPLPTPAMRPAPTPTPTPVPSTPSASVPPPASVPPVPASMLIPPMPPVADATLASSPVASAAASVAPGAASLPPGAASLPPGRNASLPPSAGVPPTPPPPTAPRTSAADAGGQKKRLLIGLVAAVAVLAIVLAGVFALGGGGDDDKDTAPTIGSITLDPANPLPGQPVTVRWSVENADTIDLAPLVEGLDADAGEHTFSEGLAEDVSLTLVAHGSDGDERREQAVPLTFASAGAEPTPTSGDPAFTPTTEAVEPTATTAVEPTATTEPDATATPGAPEATATPGVPQPTPTRYPNIPVVIATPTPRIALATPTPIGEPPAVGDVVWTTQMGDWPGYEDSVGYVRPADGGGMTVGVTGINPSGDGTMQYSWATGAATDFAVSIELRQTQTSGASFGCLTARASELNGDSATGFGYFLLGYHLCVTGVTNDVIAYASYDNGGFNSVILLETTSDVVRVNGETNTLQIIGRGPVLWFYVNDTLVGSASDSRFSGGQFGFHVFAGESTPEEWWFNNLTYRALQ